MYVSPSAKVYKSAHHHMGGAGWADTSAVVVHAHGYSSCGNLPHTGIVWTSYSFLQGIVKLEDVRVCLL